MNHLTDEELARLDSTLTNIPLPLLLEERRRFFALLDGVLPQLVTSKEQCPHCQELINVLFYTDTQHVEIE